MSDSVALDLFIQDFVNTNKLLNQHYGWETLVSRRHMEGGVLRVFGFQSGERTCYAVGRHVVLPEMECLRFEMTRTIPSVEEHRFDYLRMLSNATHTGLTVTRVGTSVVVTLTTRHRGLMNVVFIIREEPDLVTPLFA